MRPPNFQNSSAKPEYIKGGPRPSRLYLEVVGYHCERSDQPPVKTSSWFFDPNIPMLASECECNCAPRAELAELQGQMLEVWQGRIDYIQRHGFKQTHAGYVSNGGDIEKLPAIKQDADAIAERLAEPLKNRQRVAQMRCLLLDDWGRRIDDEFAHLKEAPLRDSFIADFRTKIKARSAAQRDARKGR